MADVEMHPEAQAELDATIGWYEQEWEGLGLEFLDEVDRAIARAAQQPNTWRHYTRVPDVHRLNLHRFPYSVIYRYQGPVVQIIAVPHHHRKPGYWQKRIKDIDNQ